MDGRWRIKEFAARVGVAEASLRAWERRYRLVEPARSDGGYRLYSPDDERRVVSMQAHMSRGVAPAEAARLALAEDRPADVPREPAAIVAALLDAIAAFDAARADALLAAAFALGRAAAISDVLMPAMHELGARWERGEATVAHEHFASHLAERRLMQHTADWDRGDGPLALLACPDGERHSLGLLSFGVALAERGWRIAYLGADTPLRNVADTADRLRPALVALAATHETRFTDQATAIQALATRHRVLLGGAGATASVTRRLQVDRLDGDPARAAVALT